MCQSDLLSDGKHFNLNRRFGRRFVEISDTIGNRRNKERIGAEG